MVSDTSVARTHEAINAHLAGLLGLLGLSGSAMKGFRLQKDSVCRCGILDQCFLHFHVSTFLAVSMGTSRKYSDRSKPLTGSQVGEDKTRKHALRQGDGASGRSKRVHSVFKPMPKAPGQGGCSFPSTSTRPPLGNFPGKERSLIELPLIISISTIREESRKARDV